jgi:hypothetical protein
MSVAAIGASVAGAAVGVGGSLLMNSMGGGGGGGSAPQIPIGELERMGKENARSIQAAAYGTIDAGTVKLRDVGTLKRLSNGKFAVVDEGGKTLKTFNNKDAANKFINDNRKFAVVNKDGKTLKTFNNKDAADKFIKDRKGNPEKAPALVPEVTKLSNEFVESVDKLVADGKKELNQEETNLLNRLKTHSDTLNQVQEREDALLKEDLDAITRDFQEGMSLLDEQDRAEFEAAFSSFTSQAQDLTEDFDTRASGYVDEADEETSAAIGSFQADSLSLGDRFAQQTNEALGRFESFISADNAASTLDTLSKNIFDTRQRLLAEADPRALELAAIADENAAAMMSGRISADTQANLARTSAMQALQGGFGASSGMGRGLTARDLGLTALNLQQQGFENYEAQRRLNYDTRVAGVENTALGLFGEMRTGQDSLLRNTLETAQSDRDQRQGVYGTVLNNNVTRIGDRLRSNIGIAGSVLQSGLETNRIGLDARRDNISERTTRNANMLTNTWDRNFQSRQSVYGENLNTGRSIFSTDANAAGNIFNTRANAIYQDTGARIAARDKAMGNNIAVRAGVFDSINAAKQGATATLADATMANWANNNAWKASQVSSNQSLWGSAINSTATVFGNLAGSLINRQGSNPYGWNNFDYGSGTGA